MSIASRRHIGRLAAACVAVLLVVAALALPAGALAATSSQFTNAKVTSAPNQGDPSVTFGGQPTRFTFSFTTASNVDSIAVMTLVFPKGTDLSKATVDAVTLVGLSRQQVKVQPTTTGETIKMTLSPEIGAESTLRIRAYDVVPPTVGGTMKINGTWEGVGTSGPIPEMSYEQKTPSATVAIENWLDAQPWVTAWNSVPLLNNFLKPQLLVRSVPLLFVGFLLSVALVAVAYPLGIPFGLGLAFMKMSKIGIVRGIASAYINVIRGTPLFLQIFIAFFALPLAGIRAPEFLLGVVVLALNSSAYMAEIFRAGIQSINKGQFEAASSLGMTYAEAMAFVIIPQTVRRILPTMTSEFILLFKDTALLSAVGVFELMKFAQGIAANTANVTPYLEAAAFYLILTIPLINWVGKLEARLALSEGGGASTTPRKKLRHDAEPEVPAIDPVAEAAGNVPGASSMGDGEGR